MSSQDTRHSIMTAAAREVLAHGYAGASLSSIGERLGLTKGALSYHFPTKQSLAEALLAELLDAVTTEYGAASDAWPGQPVHGLFEALLRTGLRLNDDAVVGAGLALLIDRSSPIDRIAVTVDLWQQRVRVFAEAAQATGELDPKLDPADIAEHIVVLGIAVASLFERTYEPGGTRRLTMARHVLGVLGAQHIDQVIDEVLQAHDGS